MDNAPMPLEFIDATPILINDDGSIATSPQSADGGTPETQLVTPSGAAAQLDCNIALNGSTSTSVAIAGARGIAVRVPGSWTNADIGFEVSPDGNTWLPVQKGGLNVRITNVPTGTAVVMPAPAELWCCGAFPFLRLTSLTVGANTAANQAAARALQVIYLT